MVVVSVCIVFKVHILVVFILFIFAVFIRGQLLPQMVMMLPRLVLLL